MILKIILAVLYVLAAFITIIGTLSILIGGHIGGKEKQSI